MPSGLSIVSITAPEAFRHSRRALGEGTLITAETGRPVVKGTEISLHLRRGLPSGRARFQVPLPRPRGVQRDRGWIAVEVPGGVRLAEQMRQQMQPVDARRLPQELLRSAVSPIVKAYRYHSSARSLRLSVQRLPPAVISPSAVDRVRAFTTIAADGTALTEVRITLRNRGRRALAVRLPPGGRARSVLLDGQPVRPSRRQNSGAELLIPLTRTTGAMRDSAAITVHVVLTQRLDRRLGWLGRRRLQLPRLSLPIASLAWSVFLPRRKIYSRLEGPIAPQRYAGFVPWRRPRAMETSTTEPRPEPLALSGHVGGGAGLMPVRIKLPRGGTRLEHTRYWIGAGRVVSVGFRFVDRALVYPLAALLSGLLLLFVAIVAWRRRWYWRIWRIRSAIAGWLRTLGRRYRKRERKATSLPQRLAQGSLIIVLAGCTWVFFLLLARIAG